MCSFTSAEEAYLEQNVTFSSLNILICMKYSFPKLTQFLLGNSELHAPACDTDFF
jgi:hypothetical protein